MGDITANFNIKDFQCHCPRCADNPSRPHTKIEVINAVQAIRDFLEEPVIITCGVRCEAHNKEIGGVRDSRHLPQYADAVDIAVADAYEAAAIARLAWDHGIGGATAIRPYKAHIHIDWRPGLGMLIAAPEDGGE